MESSTAIRFPDFNWDEFDTSSKSDDTTSFGFSLSSCESDENYNGDDLQQRISKSKQLQNSLTSTTTQAKTILSDETSIEKKKKKTRRRKKTQTTKEGVEVVTNEEKKEDADKEIKMAKRKKKYKNKYVKYWKDKFESYYKNDKKFNLGVIREEEGPFLFKIQIQFTAPIKGGKKRRGKKKEVQQEKEITKIPDEKIKAKVLSFFKKTQIKPETENLIKEAGCKLLFNYDKIKISKPKDNKVRAFVTVFSREDGVKIYDYFYKMKTLCFSSVIYLIASNEIFKKHTIREMKIYEHKKKKQRAEQEHKTKLEEEKKQEIEKGLDFSSSIINVEEDENDSASQSMDECYDGCNEADDEDDSN